MDFQQNDHIEAPNNQQSTVNKVNSIEHMKTQSNEPIYFNIAEESPLSWQRYLDIC